MVCTTMYVCTYLNIIIRERTYLHTRTETRTCTKYIESHSSSTQQASVIKDCSVEWDHREMWPLKKHHNNQTDDQTNNTVKNVLDK